MGETLKYGKEFANWKVPDGGAEQQKGLEKEGTGIDLEMYERSLNDGTADEYREAVGVLPAEALLEEQGDERMWNGLSNIEQLSIRGSLSKFTKENNLAIKEDRNSCMAVVA